MVGYESFGFNRQPIPCIRCSNGKQPFTHLSSCFLHDQVTIAGPLQRLPKLDVRGLYLMGKNMVANLILIWNHPDLGGVFQAGHCGIMRRLARRVLSCEDKITECRCYVLHGVDQQHLKLNTAKCADLWQSHTHNTFTSTALWPSGTLFRHIYARHWLVADSLEMG